MHLVFQLKNARVDIDNMHWQLVRTLPGELTVAQAEEMVDLKQPIHLFIKPEFDPVLTSRMIEMACEEFMDHMKRFHSIQPPCAAPNVRLVEVKLLIDPDTGIDVNANMRDEIDPIWFVDLYDEIDPIWFVIHAEVFLCYQVDETK